MQDTSTPTPLALDRTIDARDDLAWLPPPIRAHGWSVAVSASSGVVAAAVAATVLSAGTLAHVAAIGAAAGVLAARRLARAAVRQRLERLAAGGLDAVGLEAAAVGQLVYLRGRIAADRSLSGLLHPMTGVVRRTTLRLGRGRYLHEAAVDFNLVDDKGDAVTIHVDGARVLTPPPPDLLEYPGHLFAAARLPPSLARIIDDDVREAIGAGQTVPGAELVIPAGVTVGVIGYKTSTIDPTARLRLDRAPPMRTALRSGALPLLIAPLGLDEPGGDGV